MTPRQINAYLFLAGRRQEREMAQLTGVISLGTCEDGDTIKKQIEKWEGDQ